MIMFSNRLKPVYFYFKFLNNPKILNAEFVKPFMFSYTFLKIKKKPFWLIFESFFLKC